MGKRKTDTRPEVRGDRRPNQRLRGWWNEPREYKHKTNWNSTGDGPVFYSLSYMVPGVYEMETDGVISKRDIGSALTLAQQRTHVSPEMREMIEEWCEKLMSELSGIPLEYNEIKAREAAHFLKTRAGIFEVQGLDWEIAEEIARQIVKLGSDAAQALEDDTVDEVTSSCFDIVFNDMPLSVYMSAVINVKRAFDAVRQ